MSETGHFTTLLGRLESLVQRLESTQSTSSSAPTTQKSSAQQISFPPYESAQKWAQIKTQSQHVTKIQNLVLQTFNEQKKFLQVVAKTRKPNAQQLGQLIRQTSTALQEVIAVKDANRPEKEYTVLAAVAEGMPALAWVCTESLPAPHVTDMKDAAQFYANRAAKDLPEYKEVATGFISLLTELAAFVKANHTTGLVWNPNGQSPDDALKELQSMSSGTAAASNASSPAPPPPPPAPKPSDFPAAEGGKSTVPDVSALISQLNKGADVTAGLKKVDKSQMVHKNPELRKTSVVPEKAAPAAVSRKPTGAAAPTKPQKVALEGMRWVVENATGTIELPQAELDMKQTVYVYNCKDAVIKIDAKVNAVSIDNCSKSGFVIDTLVSSVDIVNSTKIQLQIMHKCPTIAIDKSDGIQLFLSEEAVDTEILTARSGEVNMMVGETEYSIGEQIKSVLKNGRIDSAVVEHKG